MDQQRDFLRLHPDQHTLWQESLSKLALACQLRSLLHLQKPDLIIDVGANHGQFALQVRELGYEGLILSLEPQKVLAEALMQQSAESSGKWIVRHGAAGDSVGELTLNTYRDDSFSSFHTPNKTAMDRFGDYLKPTDTELVEIRPLDDWLAETSLSDCKRIFLKTDTQGHDLAVLRGASLTLKHCRLVMAEGAVIPLYDTVSTQQDLVNLLEPLGFRQAGSHAISFDPRDLATLELDCLFTRLP